VGCLSARPPVSMRFVLQPSPSSSPCQSPLHLGYFLLQMTPKQTTQNYIRPLRVDVPYRGPVRASARLKDEGLQMRAAREMQQVENSHTGLAPWHIVCVQGPRTFPVFPLVALENHLCRYKLDPLLSGHECIVPAGTS
jgi:hypothetical protein